MGMEVHTLCVPATKNIHLLRVKVEMFWWNTSCTDIKQVWQDNWAKLLPFSPFFTKSMRMVLILCLGCKSKFCLGAMVGVAKRLIWKDNKLQIVYKKLENAEEMFFPSTLGSHTPWALG